MLRTSFSFLAPSLSLLVVNVLIPSASAKPRQGAAARIDLAPRPATAARGTVESVAKIQAHPPVGRREAGRRNTDRGPDRSRLPQAYGAVSSPTFPYRIKEGGTAETIRAKGADRSSVPKDDQMIVLSTGFPGTSPSETPYTPPGTQGDVSPTQILIGVNGR
ncbi:hypothetical protein EON79_18490, partial [bacterium]